MERDTRRLAVLIDAENAQVAILSELLAEIAKLGSATGFVSSPVTATLPALPAESERKACSCMVLVRKKRPHRS